MLARVIWYLHMKPLHLTHSSFRSPFSMQTQSNQVLFHTIILRFPTPVFISSSFNFKTSTCWNPITTILSVHMTKPLQSASSYYTSAVHSLPSQLLSFAPAILFKGTPHIHLQTIIRSVLPNLATSSTYTVRVSLTAPKTLWIHTLYTFLLTLNWTEFYYQSTHV